MSDKLKPVEILADSANLECTCEDTQCKWHGNCRDCVSLHRYYQTIPNCLHASGTDATSVRKD